MKWKIVLLLCGISLIIGYFLGVFLPLGLGPCEMTNTGQRIFLVGKLSFKRIA